MDSMKQMNLGELIDALAGEDGTDSVYFDFAYFRPDGVHSWRGIYSELAIGYTSELKPGREIVTVGELLAVLRAADGGVFDGYKGGEYTMWRDTAVWVSNHDEAATTAIVGVEQLAGSVVLRTWQVR
ncbi:MAG TPA: hypothetical protein VGN72_01225 [Tepidisphaeraceae bacterium]|jgi:hypothetical protein|nr:hypothetical protein [Tepidisphaeraceae bacterium]